MIIIEDKLVSRDLVEEAFVCDLTACKGACCVEGDEGAPLEAAELSILEEIYPEVEPYLTDEGRAAISEQGPWVRVSKQSYTGFATPLIKGKACAYIQYDKKGTALCGIELAKRDGKIEFLKPVSCHLYPVRVSKLPDYQAINYDKWEICSAACSLGQSLKMPLYRFLKEPLVRRFGESFYEQLDAIAGTMKKEE